MVGHVTATHQSGVVGILYNIVENTVPFRIDANGQITNTRALNRELHGSYEFHVQARTDNDEAYTSSIPVTVQVWYNQEVVILVTIVLDFWYPTSALTQKIIKRYL